MIPADKTLALIESGYMVMSGGEILRRLGEGDDSLRVKNIDEIERTHTNFYLISDDGECESIGSFAKSKEAWELAYRKVFVGVAEEVICAGELHAEVESREIRNLLVEYCGQGEDGEQEKLRIKVERGEVETLCAIMYRGSVIWQGREIIG